VSVVRVSDLAAFAADPDGYVARGGGPHSPRAAAAGTEYHAAFGRRRRPARVIVALLVIALAIAAVLLSR
jgi:hypothetical protein